jgi:hypothetical protein
MVATIGFYVTAVSFMALIAWLVLEKLIKKFGHAEFVSNSHNGVIAVATRDDFLEAKRDTKQGEFVKVKNTFVFWGVCSHTWADKSPMICDSNSMDKVIGILNDEHEPSLFVPYVSSQQMSLEEQKQFFQRFTLEEARKYVLANESSLIVRQWRKLSKWYHWELGYMSCYVSICLFLLSVISLTVWMSSKIDADRKEFMWEITTNTSVADPTPVTYREKRPIAALNDIMENRLFRFTISNEPVYLGGNIVSVEGVYSDDKLECAVRASAALNLKKGDVVTVRIGQVMNKKDHYIYEAWVITEKEAQALIASGKFRLIR